MADADPPDEVDNGPAPHDGMAGAPDTDARRDEIDDHDRHRRHQDDARDESTPPPERGLALRDARDGIGDPAGGTQVADERLALEFARRGLDDDVADQNWLL